jgi:Protein of unknown function (DUF2750)
LPSRPATSRRFIPLWPHKRYAEHELARGPWHDVAPIGIHVDDVLEQVVPDAAENGVLFAIFPAEDGQFVVARSRARAGPAR